jgi:RNA polymerase sigma factor (sigma-70 family)
VSNDTVRWMLDRAGRFPLLTTDQEIILGRRVEAYRKFVATTGERLNKNEQETESILSLSKKELTVNYGLNKEELALVGRGLKAVNRFVECNMRLVTPVAYKASLSSDSISFEEYLQQGYIGLYIAAKKFDHKKGYKFSTYATWWIRQQIGRYTLQKELVIRVPMGLLGDRARVLKELEKIKEEGEVFSIAKLAKRASTEKSVFSERKVKSLLHAVVRVDSLDCKLGNSLQNQDGATLGDFVSNPKDLEEDPHLDLLNKSLFFLTEEERFFLVYCYMKDGAPTKAAKIMSGKVESEKDSSFLSEFVAIKSVAEALSRGEKMNRQYFQKLKDVAIKRLKAYCSLVEGFYCLSSASKILFSVWFVIVNCWSSLSIAKVFAVICLLSNSSFSSLYFSPFSHLSIFNLIPFTSVGVCTSA